MPGGGGSGSGLGGKYTQVNTRILPTFYFIFAISVGTFAYNGCGLVRTINELSIPANVSTNVCTRRVRRRHLKS